jgi:hypothetical protein
VSGAEWTDDGVAGRVDIVAVNLKTGVDVAGGVGGFRGWTGGGSAGMASTVVAMTRMPRRKEMLGYCSGAICPTERASNRELVPGEWQIKGGEARAGREESGERRENDAARRGEAGEQCKERERRGRGRDVWLARCCVSLMAGGDEGLFGRAGRGGALSNLVRHGRWSVVASGPLMEMAHAERTRRATRKGRNAEHYRIATQRPTAQRPGTRKCGNEDKRGKGTGWTTIGWCVGGRVNSW